MSPCNAAELQERFDAFRPSDRAVVERCLVDDAGRAVALAATKQFVERWDDADWLDSGSVERIGRWFGRWQPRHVSNELEDWALQDETSPARQVFLLGIRRGVSLQESHPA